MTCKLQLQEEEDSDFVLRSKNVATQVTLECRNAHQALDFAR
jgi:hypothetical protein